MVMEADKPQDAKSPQIETQSESSLAGCDACGSPMKPMGHCKYWCLRCGFLRTCNDVI
jgi:hypothetical protein